MELIAWMQSLSAVAGLTMLTLGCLWLKSALKRRYGF